jgi:hypothetical protein
MKILIHILKVTAAKRWQHHIIFIDKLKKWNTDGEKKILRHREIKRNRNEEFECW